MNLDFVHANEICPVCGKSLHQEAIFACWPCWKEVMQPEWNRLNKLGFTATHTNMMAFATNYRRKQKLAAL